MEPEEAKQTLAKLWGWMSNPASPCESSQLGEPRKPVYMPCRRSSLRHALMAASSPLLRMCVPPRAEESPWPCSFCALTWCLP